MKYIIVKVGCEYFKVEIVNLIVQAMKKSRSEVKRLIKGNAVEIYLK